MTLTKEEFYLLSGTEIMISMLRNRVEVKGTSDIVGGLLEFLDVHGTGLYYLNDDNLIATLYCENFFDAENVKVYLNS